MSIAAIGAPRVADQQGSTTKAFVGAGVGAAVATTIGLSTAKALNFPAPVAITAGALIGGPIAAVSILNNTGEQSSPWLSMAVGAAPLAVAGGALGAFGAGWQGGKLGAGIATGAVMFGLAGAAIGGVTHLRTKPD